MDPIDFSKIIRFILAGLFFCVSAQASSIDLRAYSLAQNYHYSWDPVAKNALVEGAGSRFQFHAGSEYFLKNGRLQKMDEKAVIWNDSLIAPSSAASFLPGSAPVRLASVLPGATHQIRKVVVDAGHGGKDTGAVSKKGLREKRVALEVARKVRQGLEARGIQVIMTRGADVFIPLAERAHIANKNGADLFVSIHANASTSPSLQGFEVYTLSEATDDQALAVQRAENSVLRFEPGARASLTDNLKTILWDLRETQNRKESLRVSSRIAEHVAGSVSTAARRERSANFYVLKWTECPAVLVELAYLSNYSDEKRLRDPVYRSRIADAVVEGVMAYKKEFDLTNGYTQ